jgi:hypothetical protein
MRCRCNQIRLHGKLIHLFPHCNLPLCIAHIPIASSLLHRIDPVVDLILASLPQSSRDSYNFVTLTPAAAAKSQSPSASSMPPLLPHHHC